MGGTKGPKLVVAGDAEERLVLTDADHVTLTGVVGGEVDVAQAPAQQDGRDRAAPDRKSAGAFDRRTAARLHAAGAADQIVDVVVGGGGVRHARTLSLPGS